MTASAKSPPDLRRRPRPRMAMSGQIVHGFHGEVADVVVRNLTEGGAKVRLTSTVGVTVQGRVVLRLAAGDRSGVVAWQSGDEIGLKFE